MQPSFLSRCLPALVVAAFCEFSQAWAAAPDGSPASEHPFGIAERVPWTGSRLTESPEPAPPYRLERAFPKLKFKEPVDLSGAPGSSRVFVVELSGKIFSFPNRADVEQADPFFDVVKAVKGAEQVYGLAFHPKFEANHYIYICYVQKGGLPDGTHVSRFTVIPGEIPRVDPASETLLLTWLSGGHNGGCLKFGPDGYLYISAGDTADPNPPDPLNTGQDISDLPSSVMRIDVDQTDPGKNYHVPADNPFVHTPGARPEVWAYGFRNPWKMSFDRQAGHLWVGDVGWELWEMVYRVERGGNYGWSIVEGPQSIKPKGKRGPTPILPPVIAHPHSEAASITGGYVYRGHHLTDLVGAYLYGDWVTGKIWGLRYDGSRVTWKRELASTALQIISFAEQNDGEILVMDFSGMIHRLEPNPAARQGSHFPRKLSQTGLFASVPRGQPAPGVIPFTINAEQWADSARGERFVALPGVAKIEVTPEKWVFPKDTVLAKTLSLELETGQPASRRRLETQVLRFDGNAWEAYTYLWNADQTDADLAAAAGLEKTYTVIDPAAPGGKRQQTWHVASRAECLRCHNPWAGPPLAFNALQLNRDQVYPPSGADAAAGTGGVTDQQLRTLAHIGLFSAPPASAPRLTNPYDRSAALDERARSYLHVNCAHCHREGAGGSVASHMAYDLKPADAKLIGVKPSQGDFGLPGASVVAPGDPFRSVLFYRVSTLGSGRMPRIGSTVVDMDGTALLHDWIQSLPPSDGTAAAAPPNDPRGALDRLRAAGSASREIRAPMIDELLGSTRGALALLYEMDHASLAAAARQDVLDHAAVASSPMVHDLFERLLPEGKRTKRLGSVIHPSEVLALKGDAAAGKRLFFQESGPQCARCHRALGQGTDFGPDLSQIARKYSRASLLDNIIFPSKTIEPRFVTYQAETKDETSYAGFLLKQTAGEIVLKVQNAPDVHLRAADVKSLTPQKASAMPEQLLQGLTAQNAADLLEFLSTLK